MRYQMVSVKNVGRLVEAGRALIDRGPGLPGMGLIWGKTGAGKTTATTWFVNRCHGVYVRALATWSPGAMLASILRELDAAPRQGGSCAAMVESIVQKLAESGRPLFIDEADYVVESKRMTETLRDLHDLTSVPVILVGMEGLQRKIALRHQLAGRIAQWVEFGPCDVDDAEQLAKALCEVTVAPDLIGKLHKKAGGSIRLLVVGLARIELRAKAKGLSAIDAAEWKRDDDFFLAGPEAGRAH